MRDELVPNLAIVEPGLRKAISKVADISSLSEGEAFRNYTKYVLYHGTKFEKTQLVRNVALKLTLHDRKIKIQNERNN